jgi:hypothetical protein
MNGIDISHLFQRVANWNAARYDRVYSKDLLVKLLLEELNETMSAPDAVETLDGLCDISYVALGGVWKLGLDERTTVEMWNHAVLYTSGLGQLESNHDFIRPTAYITACINQLMEWDEPNKEAAGICFAILLLCFTQAASWWNMSFDQFIRAMHTVCDSNDSKSVKKVAADVKANDNDKGDKFVPPTAGLLEVLQECGVVDFDSKTKH